MKKTTSGVKAQVWLGFAGTVLASIISLIGTIYVATYAPGP